jgi:hypothetical protein
VPLTRTKPEKVESRARADRDLTPEGSRLSIAINAVTSSDFPTSIGARIRRVLGAIPSFAPLGGPSVIFLNTRSFLPLPFMSVRSPSIIRFLGVEKPLHCSEMLQL